MKIPGTKLRRKPGKPALFDSPNDLLDYFYSYIDDCAEDNKIPNVAGFRAFIACSRSTLIEYERKDEYQIVFEIMKDVLEDEIINSKCVKSDIVKLILQSKFDYAEKIESKQHNTNVSIAPDEAERLLQAEYERIKSISSTTDTTSIDVKKV